MEFVGEIIEVAVDAVSNYYNNSKKNSTKNNAQPLKPDKNANKKTSSSICDRAVQPKNSNNSSVGDENPKPPEELSSSPQELIPQISSDSILQGILWSEILAKPVSQRRGRW